ncbi:MULTISPECIES: helix-turn-helix domain-containing protein [Dickeya]|uniref:winged helix-turn-helix transcriptional regulator n=1 Tax=Dickeya TaxID=204037 RepID=UPI00039B9F04|nr:MULTISPECIES: helix-turn-helix domain-containing protein [Dickeya]AYH48001.1 transcriptional regulator [Dickeya fangzhongdai]MBO8134872.1 helix-turn-helix transcriptional regulator [Dickeya fangzhongdai]UGA52886.1 helix-turn-helix transcriptional regulator [Dickeya fangzhongdai]ULR33083.1 helix-turn-helix transcriptional regulator [Dickeya fangzhongdai]UMB78750.1 helix-turn-helix transcriptional regulator [Dickeya fangzhongdai]
MLKPCVSPFSHANCPSRFLLEQIADKWSVLVLGALCEKPLRFNEIKRSLEGITQKALTQCLRKLERNGIVERRVLTFSPIAVEYHITPLGHTLKEPFQALYRWTVEYLPQVALAREVFDQRQEEQTRAMSDSNA